MSLRSTHYKGRPRRRLSSPESSPSVQHKTLCFAVASLKQVSNQTHIQTHIQTRTHTHTHTHTLDINILIHYNIYTHCELRTMVFASGGEFAAQHCALEKSFVRHQVQRLLQHRPSYISLFRKGVIVHVKGLASSLQAVVRTLDRQMKAIRVKRLLSLGHRRGSFRPSRKRLQQCGIIKKGTFGTHAHTHIHTQTHSQSILAEW